MFTIILNKKRLICIAAFLAVTVLCVVLLCLKPAAQKCEATDREKLLENLGYRINYDAAQEEKQIVIPTDFSDVYKNYNLLQRRCGYDLEPYKGKTATVYTITLQGEDLYAHIIAVDGKIIGGDIANNSVGGSMKGLVKNET